MNFTQKMFLRALEEAPNEVVMMSRKDCHQLGLDSVVVDKASDGRLTRAFFAHPNHSMYLNGDVDTLSLGVHNHQYNINLTKLYGTSYNIGFSDDNLGYRSKYPRVRKYRYKSQLGGGGGIQPMYSNEHNLQQTSFEEITTNYIHHSELHTVLVHKGEKAAWIVEEGLRVNDETLLYTSQSPSRIAMAGKGYSKFKSKDQVVDMVEGFFNA